jgi:hypothetical protein
MKIRKVVCINVRELIKEPLYLTYGKVYDHIDYDDGISSFISVIDDSGFEFNHKKDRFISIEEWREKQLNELGI